MGKAAVVQSVSSDPKELFDPSTFPEPTYLSDKFAPLGLGLAGFLYRALHNYSCRRPIFSGIPHYIAFTLGGLALGTWYQRRNELYYAERDAIYRHYIELHPEDFQPKERVVVGDMFKPWYPIR